MITLRKITLENRRALFNLEVSEEQHRFVASNLSSVAEAMIKILEFIHISPAGPAQNCWISYKADNLPAKKLYESFGFRDNGEILGDELITVLPLEGGLQSELR